MPKLLAHLHCLVAAQLITHRQGGSPASERADTTLSWVAAAAQSVVLMSYADRVIL